MQQQTTNYQRISFMAGTILVVVAILVGVMVFYVMQRHAEKLLRSGFQSSLQNQVALAQLDIRQGFERGMTVATRPFLIDQIQHANTHDDHAAVLNTLNLGARSFLVNGLSAIALFDKNGRVLVQAGEFVRQPTLTVPIHSPGHAQLLFKDAYFLRTHINIVRDGQIVGSTVTETPLPTLSSLFINTRRVGKTADLAVCVAAGLNMQCFPTTLNPHVMRLAKRSPSGVALPMTYALEGATGFIAAQDYRDQKVVAAYSPVGDLGLGMVLKMDGAELYAPVWNQLRYLLPLMLLVLAVALLLLRWQLFPLVRKLVRSEREAREASARLRDSENRARTVLETVDEGIISLSESGAIELFNPGAERMFGYRSADVMGRNVSMLLPEPGSDAQQDSFLGCALDPDPSQLAGTGREVLAQRSGGETFPMELRISACALKGRRQFIGVMRDITARKAAEAKITHLAHYDALTDLPNRRLVQDRIQQAIARTQRAGTQFGVLFIDLDKFKNINDSLGHDVGDQLLQMVAQRLDSLLRAEDTVGRQGGDEFIVLLASLSAAEDAARVAQKILAILSAPFVVNGRDLRTSASIGIAVYPQDGGDVATLLKNSDTAMYHAKDAGRSEYQFFTPAMNAAAAERLLLESGLRQAIERGELRLHYQPLVNIAAGTIVATEALVRWDHPELGLISPARFIPIAENSGLIIPLGEWVLRQACCQLKQWREQGLACPRMVVNLSPRQFRQKHLVQNFVRVLRETGVDPHWLGLEITETVVMENPEKSIGILAELHALGIELSLDDFGTGYSSLGYLKRFPIDKLKIDQSFVRDITTDANDAAMVAAIIVMAHQLNIRVVAEGVETEAQLAFLREHACNEYQGYYFSRPLSADALAGFLSA